jgi:hypothetical protein
MENTEIIEIKKRGRKKVIYENKQEKYKKYNSTYYEKHKNDESIKCELCGGKYKWSNKSHHIKGSKKHLKAISEKIFLRDQNIT